MTILRIINRHVGWDTYDAVNTKIDIEHQHPLGLIMHGDIEVGETMRVAQIWESEEYAHRYDEKRLKPALQAVGAPLDAEVAIFELHHLVTP